MARTLLERYESRVDRSDVNGCHPWTGGDDGVYGYGKISVEGRTRSAHRVGWELLHGPIPEGMLLRHTCDNPPCQNPDHWVLGTDADNQRDSIERGRHATQRLGDEANAARLTDEQVADIRRRYIPRGELGHVYGSRKALAEEFGVRPEYISMLMHEGEAGRRT